MNLSKWPNALIALLALLLLSGCFTSKTPLLSEADADFPFSTITYEFPGEDDIVTLIRSGNGYTAPEEQGNGRLQLKQVSENVYLIQVEVKDDDEELYLYALARLSADKKSAELVKPFAMDKDRRPHRRGATP